MLCGPAGRTRKETAVNDDLKVATTTEAPKGWNWGAFFLTWIWGIFNKTWIAFLVFAPFANLVMPFVLGAKGNEWAWNHAKWEGVDHFQRVQKRWAIAGLVVFCLGILSVVGLFGAILLAMKSSNPYQAAYSMVQHSEQAKKVLGEPIHDGLFFSGNIETSGPTGKADISFTVNGPKGEATAYLSAQREQGRWITKSFELEPKGRSERLEIAPQGSRLKGE
jgi:hypothetical protein